MLTLILYLLAAVYITAYMQPINLITRLRGLGVGPQLPSPSTPLRRGNPSSPSSSSQPEQPQDDSYKPSPIDILVTRILLTKCKKLPADLCDIIFDYAEYWAHSTNEIDYNLEHKSPLRIVGRSRKEDHFLIRSFPIGLTTLKDREDLADVLQYDTNETKPRPLRKEHPPAFFSKLADYPTPRLAHPVRKVVFTTTSRDQGSVGVRTGDKTYKDGWTWFEAGLERFEADQECDAQCVSDARFKSTKSVASKLPMCALRPIYPTFSPANDPASTQTPSKDGEQKYKYDHGHLPVDERLIQRNQTRNREVKTHVVQWSWTDDIDPESDAAEDLVIQGRGRGTGDGSFVRDLKMGDVVTVWGKAKFPAWVNNVDKVKVDVYWAV
ncbi:Ankyrin repeat protein [Sarocladium implicatum]|nr:Ankyrin repeat protein [Sarocladium implicatum]